MSKALLVIDIQEDFMGEDRNKKKCKYRDNQIKEFAKRVNREITKSKKEGDYIIYIKEELPNTVFFKLLRMFPLKNTDGANVLKDIKVESKNVFNKMFPNAFTNKDFVKFIKDKNITEVKLIGIDGCKCVYATAKGALKHNLKTYIVKDCIETLYPKKLEQCKGDLYQLGVRYL